MESLDSDYSNKVERNRLSSCLRGDMTGLTDGLDEEEWRKNEKNQGWLGFLAWATEWLVKVFTQKSKTEGQN